MHRDTSQWRFETKSVHAGYWPEPTTHAVAVPLYQTVAYAFDSAQHGADLRGHRRDGPPPRHTADRGQHRAQPVPVSAH